MELDLSLDEYKKEIRVIKDDINRSILLLLVKMFLYISMIFFYILPSILIGLILRYINRLFWLGGLFVVFAPAFFIKMLDKILEKYVHPDKLDKITNILDFNLLNEIRELSWFLKNYKYMLWIRKNNILLTYEDRSRIIFHGKFPSKKMLLKQKRKEGEQN